MTMIRLSLNLSGRDLGYWFGGISDSTVSRTLLHVVVVQATETLDHMA